MSNFLDMSNALDQLEGMQVDEANIAGGGHQNADVLVNA
jgi:hypothetical protein